MGVEERDSDMFVIYSVESNSSRIQLTQQTVVCLLVGLAIYANAQAFHRVAEIRRDMAFQEQLGRNLDALQEAADAIAERRPR